MRAVDVIARKRDGGSHPPEEIRFLVDGAVHETIPDDQLAAWLMAVVLRGLDDDEVDALCAAMVESGEVIDLSSLGRPAVDKHSTGGVGDKVTIALAPLVAACGAPCAKMSGRGLGHTGGTLDKLEAIPGFRVDLLEDAFVRQVEEIGCAVVAQSDRLVPADRILYALRDVTATVPSPGLIATSVMSKKLAAGAEAILLDVKVGDGAFMATVEEARELARLMAGLGTRAGRRVSCELTRMDVPLGRAVGNAVEVAEAFDVLRGEGPAVLDGLVRGSAAALLELGGYADAATARAQVDDAIASGAAVETAERWVAAQGGEPRTVAAPWDVLERAPVVAPVPAPRDGVLDGFGALAVGLATVRLGAGRARKGDPVDPAVGIVLALDPGDAVGAGEPIAWVHARDRGAADTAAAEVLAAARIVDGPVDAPPVVIETIHA